MQSIILILSYFAISVISFDMKTESILCCFEILGLGEISCQFYKLTNKVQIVLKIYFAGHNVTYIDFVTITINSKKLKPE